MAASRDLVVSRWLRRSAVLAATFALGACGGSVSTTPPDEDTGTLDDSSVDSTTPPPDGTPIDTYVPPDDTPVVDTGVPPTDTGPADTGPVDTGIVPVDGGCPTGMVVCGSFCVDLTKDTSNCGKCGTVCPSGATCTIASTGAPACTCPGSTVICGSKCAALDTDPANCGGCGISCGSAGTCVSGKCVCPTGSTTCGTTCVDTTKDPLNCSGCGKRCAAFGACTAGSCSCPAGSTICGGSFGRPIQCTDTNADPNFCGTTGCGTRCGDRSYCDGTGKCACRPGLTSCTFGGGSACLDTNASPNACGGCGTVCPAGQTCDGGKCSTATTCSTGKTRCLAGGTGGGAIYGCYDTMKDPMHCGACGDACAVDELCVAGSCQRYAPAVSCTTCPCTDCALWMGGGGGTATCCPKLPGQKSPICVRGSACP